MMRFDIITIFPKAFDSYFNQSIIWRAQAKSFIKINAHDLRDFTRNRRKTVDERPYGGGAGMVMQVGPIFKAVNAIKQKAKNKKQKIKVILFSAKGKKFDQRMAEKFSKLDQLIMICGHYEGVDERVAKYIANDEISIGDYVLTGGELPAMLVVDAVTRLIPGVIKAESLREESFSLQDRSGGELKIKNPASVEATAGKQKLKIIGEYPQYTRPEIFEPKKGIKWRAPKILLSGNHKKIADWRQEHSKK